MEGFSQALDETATEFLPKARIDHVTFQDEVGSTNSNNAAPAGNTQDLHGGPRAARVGGNSRLVINEVDETEDLTLDSDRNAASNAKIVLAFNTVYLQTCPGMLRVFQVVTSLTVLIVLTTTHGAHYTSYLLLPNSPYYRVMVFVLVFSLLFSALLLFVYTCDLNRSVPYNWPFIDFALHTTIALLYIIGTTLIACTHDFYHKPTSPYVPGLSNRLLVVVVMGYVTMVAYGLTAVHGFQKWQRVVPYRFQQQPLLEDLDHFEI